MKKMYLFVLIMVLFVYCGSGQKKILLKTARAIGNNYENGGRFLNHIPDLNAIIITGITSGPTDLSLTNIPRVVNANINQDIFCASFTDKIDSTIKPVLFNGNGYDFINEVTVNNSTSDALMGGHYNGTISVLGKSKTCNSPTGNCGFLAMVDKYCQPFFFKDIQSTGNLTISDVKWTKNDNFVVGINYTGSFTIGLNTVTAKGLTDAYLAVCDTFLTPKWGVTLSAPGYEFIDAISYNDQSNEITATMSIDPLFSGPVTYSSSSGFTTTLTPTSYAYNNVIMKINADNGNLLDHTVIGSTSNYNIEEAYTIGVNTFIAGSANSELHPDMNNLSVTVPNKGGVDIVGLLYQGLHNFAKSLNPSGSGDDVLFSIINTDEILEEIRASVEAKIWCIEKGLIIPKSASLGNGKTNVDEFTLRGALYFIDEDLNVVDSILLDGTGISAIYDGDLDSLGNLYITGDFTGTVDLDPSENNYNLTSAGGRDMFVAQYDASALFTTSFKPVEDNSFVKVYPVPAKNNFYIEANFKKSTSGEILVQDISGRTLLIEPFANETFLRKQIPIGLPPGILFVQISTSKENIVKKLLVQR